MPVNREPINDSFQCQGGLSFRSNHGPYRYGEDKWEKYHERGTPYQCRNCGTYMGCSKCIQMPAELVCLKCNNWALPEGEKEHGRMMRKGNFSKKVKDLIGGVKNA